ncbi:unnamed protein product [Paramecium sonneborni]|uniref:Uncharacterized protein n=1 Tax=Paramecium sonneborni TaxID=65129 RepID=A0A8S1RSQ5_9CILI|nr:unnamed protein product [Paramecium sonneborni]
MLSFQELIKIPSYEDIFKFFKILSQTQKIKVISLLTTQRFSLQQGIIHFSIQQKLKIKKKKFHAHIQNHLPQPKKISIISMSIGKIQSPLTIQQTILEIIWEQIYFQLNIQVKFIKGIHQEILLQRCRIHLQVFRFSNIILIRRSIRTVVAYNLESLFKSAIFVFISPFLSLQENFEKSILDYKKCLKRASLIKNKYLMQNKSLHGLKDSIVLVEQVKKLYATRNDSYQISI